MSNPPLYIGRMNIQINAPIDGRPILSLHKFCEQAGISDVTAWRWRKRGWLVTFNIAGRQYLTDKTLTEFTRRAEAGEFVKQCGIAKQRHDDSD